MSDQTVTDATSGLFSEAMLTALLPSRVATARRTLRQLGLVVAAVEDGPAPDELAELVRASIRDSDVAARLDDGSVALVLEFTPAEGCVVVAERLRDQVLQASPDARYRAGVACYPAHAISADELRQVARQALEGAAPGEVGVASVPE